MEADVIKILMAEGVGPGNKKSTIIFWGPKDTSQVEDTVPVILDACPTELVEEV